MNRLTCRFDETICFRKVDGDIFIPCRTCETSCENCAFAMVTDKLAEYEDIGLDPEEIKDKLHELNRLSMMYEERKVMKDCHDCGITESCKYLPKLGELVRINCPLWRERR